LHTLNKCRLRKLVQDKARLYKLKHTVVEPWIFVVESQWAMHGHLDWFRVNQRRARLLLDEEPHVTTIALAVILDAIKKDMSYYFESMTQEEIFNEAQLGTTDSPEQVSASIVSTTDLGRYRE
jgi:hypothetical protein